MNINNLINIFRQFKMSIYRFGLKKINVIRFYPQNRKKINKYKNNMILFNNKNSKILKLFSKKIKFQTS